MKIVQIEGQVAVTDLDGVKRKARIDLLENVAVGDYVLVHAGLAIAKVDEDEAQETLSLLRGLGGYEV